MAGSVQQEASKPRLYSWLPMHPSRRFGHNSPADYFLENEDPQFTEEVKPVKRAGAIHPFADPNEEEVPFLTCTPEKILYYEVLKRACWDLEPHIDCIWRRCAMLWFRLGLEGREQPEALVSFLDCVEVLELGEKEIQYLRVKYHEAEKIPDKEEAEYQLQKERQSYRIATRALLARERMSQCSEDQSIQRERGYLGCGSTRRTA